MIKIRMLTSLSGPALALNRGDAHAFPDREAVRLVNAGYAELANPGDVEAFDAALTALAAEDAPASEGIEDDDGAEGDGGADDSGDEGGAGDDGADEIADAGTAGDSAGNDAGDGDQNADAVQAPAGTAPATETVKATNTASRKRARS